MRVFVGECVTSPPYLNVIRMNRCGLDAVAGVRHYRVHTGLRRHIAWLWSQEACWMSQPCCANSRRNNLMEFMWVVVEYVPTCVYCTSHHFQIKWCSHVRCR